MADYISIVCSILSVICAAASLAAAILIGLCQVKQGKRMEALALRQDEEVKRQKAQQLKAQRDTFLMKYFNERDDIYLLPLCWVAALYNPALAYHRNMFREYNMLEEDVQNAICEYVGLKLPNQTLKGQEFYGKCSEAIRQTEKKYHCKEAQTTQLFYEGAKYLYRGIELYRAKELPIDLDDLETHLISRLHMFDENPTSEQDPLGKFADDFGFQTCPEINACEICAVAAKVLAEWDCQPISFQENTEISSIDNPDKEVNFWIPGEYAHEKLKTMEDVFLCALFSIYVNLVLPNQGSGVSNGKNK